MTEYRSEKTKLRVKASEDTGAKVARFLRRRHPAKTADAVHAETGIAVTTIKTWLEGLSVPGGIATFRLISAYGPDFLIAVMDDKPHWLDDAWKANKQAYLDSRIADLRAQREAL